MSNNKPTNNKPTNINPTNNKPTNNKPTNNKPTTDNPTTNNPTNNLKKNKQKTRVVTIKEKMYYPSKNQKIENIKNTGTILIDTKNKENFNSIPLGSIFHAIVDNDRATPRETEKIPGILNLKTLPSTTILYHSYKYKNKYAWVVDQKNSATGQIRLKLISAHQQQALSSTLLEQIGKFAEEVTSVTPFESIFPKVGFARAERITITEKEEEKNEEKKEEKKPDDVKEEEKKEEKKPDDVKEKAKKEEEKNDVAEKKEKAKNKVVEKNEEAKNKVVEISCATLNYYISFATSNYYDKRNKPKHFNPNNPQHFNPNNPQHFNPNKSNYKNSDKNSDNKADSKNLDNKADSKNLDNKADSKNLDNNSNKNDLKNNIGKFMNSYIEKAEKAEKDKIEGKIFSIDETLYKKNLISIYRTERQNQLKEVSENVIKDDKITMDALFNKLETIEFLNSEQYAEKKLETFFKTKYKELKSENQYKQHQNSIRKQATKEITALITKLTKPPYVRPSRARLKSNKNSNEAKKKEKVNPKKKKEEKKSDDVKEEAKNEKEKEEEKNEEKEEEKKPDNVKEEEKKEEKKPDDVKEEAKKEEEKNDVAEKKEEAKNKVVEKNEEAKNKVVEISCATLNYYISFSTSNYFNHPDIFSGFNHMANNHQPIRPLKPSDFGHLIRPPKNNPQPIRPPKPIRPPQPIRPPKPIRPPQPVNPPKDKPQPITPPKPVRPPKPVNPPKDKPQPITPPKPVRPPKPVNPPKKLPPKADTSDKKKIFNEILNHVLAAIEKDKNKKKKQKKNFRGQVVSLKDGIVLGNGLKKITQNAQVYFKAKGSKKYLLSNKKNILTGVVMELNKNLIKIVLLGESDRLVAGTTIIYKKKKISSLSINVDTTFCGAIVDPLGKNLLTVSSTIKKHAKQKLIEIKAPGIITRESITEPLLTGLKVIDALLPIGRGQRELIIGDRGVGKTTIAIDTILNQAAINTKTNIEVYCVYVAIGQKRTSIQNIYELLQKFDSTYYTIIVATTASDTAALQFYAPYAGAAISEYFRDAGEDALIVYDDLSKHAVAYRQLSLLLRRPPGREAYPGDIFYVHSRLLERAAKLNSAFGGGSLTALPIVETQAGDVSGYIPTNIISITDGQIFLEKQLFYQGIRPAVNVGLSVSRVGSAAQTKTMKSIAGNLKLKLANYREVASFAQFDTEIDETTKQLIQEGEILTEVLKQKQNSPFPLYKQLLVLTFALNGFFSFLNLQLNGYQTFESSFFNNNLLLEKDYSFILNNLGFNTHILDLTALDTALSLFLLNASILSFRHSLSTNNNIITKISKRGFNSYVFKYNMIKNKKNFSYFILYSLCMPYLDSNENTTGKKISDDNTISNKNTTGKKISDDNTISNKNTKEKPMSEQKPINIDWELRDKLKQYFDVKDCFEEQISKTRPRLKDPSKAVFSVPLVDPDKIPPLTDENIKREKEFGHMHRTLEEKAIIKSNMQKMDAFHAPNYRTISQNDKDKLCDKIGKELCDKALEQLQQHISLKNTKPSTNTSATETIKKTIANVSKNPETVLITATVVAAGTGVIMTVICVDDYCRKYNYHPFDNAYNAVKNFFKESKEESVTCDISVLPDSNNVPLISNNNNIPTVSNNNNTPAVSNNNDTPVILNKDTKNITEKKSENTSWTSFFGF